jgi:hypothetical protein
MKRRTAQQQTAGYPKVVTPKRFYRGSSLPVHHTQTGPKIRLDSRSKHAGMTDFGKA